MNALVGYTGFVGSNLYTPDRFEKVYNSRNIREAYGTRPDLLVFAGLRAEKYLADHEPEKDMALIREAEQNIERIDPRKLVLISTIDVFRDPRGKDETSPVETEGLAPYGYDRYRLELWVRSRYPDALIIRLPGLFGKNIKKNFIYDFIQKIPFMLKENKFDELSARAPVLKEYYQPQGNGFYKAAIPEDKKTEVRALFEDLGFTALSFTDSRSRYQFYDLSRLYADMTRALEAGLALWHPATEPVTAGELYHFLTGKEFVNLLPSPPADYDYRTVHDGLFGGRGGYIRSRQQVMEDVRRFVTK